MRALWTLFLLGGCAAMLGHGPPLEEAAEQEQATCGGRAPLVEDERLFRDDAVESIEPLSVAMSTHGNREVRQLGARLHVPALPGLTSEWLERNLRCHAARRVLAHDGEDRDPYVLPGSWVDISVRTEPAGFVVVLRADTVEDGRRVLDRARSFFRR